MFMGLTLEELLQPTEKRQPADKPLTEAQRIASEKFRNRFFIEHALLAELIKTKN